MALAIFDLDKTLLSGDSDYLWGRFLADLITRTLSITVLWFLVDRARLKALDALEYGDATNMLGLPIWPFYALLALGMAACALIFALQIVTVLVTMHPYGETRHD